MEALKMHLRLAGVIVVAFVLVGCATNRFGSAPATDCKYRDPIPLTQPTIDYLAANDRPHLEADVQHNETLEKECGVEPPNG